MKVHCRQLFTNKDEGGKKKMERKTFSRGLRGAGDQPVSGAVTGERAALAEPLRSRCCFLIGNSVSNKAFHLLSLVKCFHSKSK